MAQIVIDYALLAISIVILATCTGIIWIAINRRMVERIASIERFAANNNAEAATTTYPSTDRLRARTANRSRAGGVGGPYPTDIGYDAGYGDNTVYFSGGGGSGDGGHSSADGGGSGGDGGGGGGD